MDLDWCGHCGKKAEEGRLYCSAECERLDEENVQATQFNAKEYQHTLNDFAELHEGRILQKQDEHAPKLSELRQMKRNAKQNGGGLGGLGLGGANNEGFGGIAAGSIAGPPPAESALRTQVEQPVLSQEEIKRRELEDSKNFLRSYQRKRIWSTPDAIGMPSPQTANTRAAAAAGATATATAAEPDSTASTTATLPKTMQARSYLRHSDPPPFLSMSIPVSTTELDPSVFLKQKTSGQYMYEPRKYERDGQYASELMNQPWFNQQSQ